MTTASPSPGTASSHRTDASAGPGKGLRSDALGLLDSLAIGIASTGPAYSMAATLGLVAAAVALQGPAVVLLAFVPMFFAALGYHALNRAEPDCGTSFVWVARALGPSWGWMAGWAIVVADVLVMASLAQVAGQYSFLLAGADGIGSQPTHPAVLALGVGFIVLLTWICVRGIALTARLQQLLVVVETVMLVVFSVVALWRVYSTPEGAGPLPGSVRPSWSWLDPAAVESPGALVSGVLLMVFLYWGWDSVLSVNEETRSRRRIPGLAAVWSTVVLLAVYVLFTIAAQAVAGVGTSGQGLANPEHADDIVAALATVVFGDGTAGRVATSLLVLMVLTSAAASTQTTLLPTARTTFSMAWHGALPEAFGRVHPRWGTPTVSTWAMGAVSIAVYVPMNFLAGGRGIADAVTACGVAIGFYYGLTALASTVLHLRSPGPRRWMSTIALPAIGGLLLLGAAAWTAVDAFTPGDDETSVAVPGTDVSVGGVFLFGVVGLGIGLPLMWWWRRVSPGFFTDRALSRHLPGAPDQVSPELVDRD